MNLRVGKMINTKTLRGLFICTFVLGAVNLSILKPCKTSLATGITYEQSVDELYGSTFKSIFYDRVAGSPIEATASDGVDLTNGRLVITRTDLELEGRGGFDFELRRYYDSNEAILGTPSIQHVDELPVDVVYINFELPDGKGANLNVNREYLTNHKKAFDDLTNGNYTVTDYDGMQKTEHDTQRTKILSKKNYNVYGIDSGWRYDLPWIEDVAITEETGWESRPAYIHFGSIGTMEIETDKVSTSKTYKITGIKDYTYKDVELKDYRADVDGISVRYLLRDKTGLRTYFNSDGVVVLMRDKHDNTIRFEYRDKIYLKKITDSVGREINFNYDSSGMKRLISVTVDDKKNDAPVTGGVSKKAIEYTYEDRYYTPHNSSTISGTLLKSATVDSDTENYEYQTAERFMSTSGRGVASQRTATNENYLLTKIKTDSRVDNYEYRPAIIRGYKEDGTDQKRDIVTENFYVTRSYATDLRTGKRSEGYKYDYYQRQYKDGEFLFLTFDDFFKIHDEIMQYGMEKLETATLISTFDPNSYTPEDGLGDYIYEKTKLNKNTLRLASDTKKSVELNIYNEDKLEKEHIGYGKSKSENIYTYDTGSTATGGGSLVVLETIKKYGEGSKRCTVTKHGYTYDDYRNLFKDISSEAYTKKGAGKEKFFTTTYTYVGTDDGYPDDDTPGVKNVVLTEESYLNENTKVKSVCTLTSDGLDVKRVEYTRSIGGGDYETLTRTDTVHDSYGNVTKETEYPSYLSAGKAEKIVNEYEFNDLSQQVKQTVKVVSATHPESNTEYTEETTVYDYFGNELKSIDSKGNVTLTTYDPDTGEELTETENFGTVYETKDTTYVSGDRLKTMTIDASGRCSVTISDAFGDTLISKDEKSARWTESTYIYRNQKKSGTDDEGSSAGGSEEDAPTSPLLDSEYTYEFIPTEKRLQKDENGDTVGNFYIEGRGNAILSSSKNFYDRLGNSIGSASFLNGDQDGAHCTGWSFDKDDIKTGTAEELGIEDEIEEITDKAPEADEIYTVTTTYSKSLDSAHYTPDVDVDNYYNQFDSYVLTESISETISDETGRTIREISTEKRGADKSVTTTDYTYDFFGRTEKTVKTIRKYVSGSPLEAYITQTSNTYDDMGYVSGTETKSKKEKDTDWVITKTKSVYDEKGQVIQDYTPGQISDDIPSEYEYDINGNKIKEKIPHNKSGSKVIYSENTYRYDESGNLIRKEERIDDKNSAVTEYAYDERDNLILVKTITGENTAEYVQYLYDSEGRKIRQFTGLTKELGFDIVEDTDTAGSDTYSDNAKIYSIKTSGAKKSDVISEIKYGYDDKGKLISVTDPEGKTENYEYDVHGNQTKTVKRNHNVVYNIYDTLNRLISVEERDTETDRTTKHIYKYDKYGQIFEREDITPDIADKSKSSDMVTTFGYEDVSGQETSETVTYDGKYEIKKEYTYDSEGNKSSISISNDKGSLYDLKYTYDGASRLVSVNDKSGNELAAYAYDEDGNTVSKRAGAVSSSYTYNLAGELTTLENRKATGSVALSEYTTAYLQDGKKSEENYTYIDEQGTNTTGKKTYTYDLSGRIKTETATGEKGIYYSYDSHGNRKTLKQGDEETTYQYDKNDELTRTDTLDKDGKRSVTIYKNDSDGNQLATVHRYDIPKGTDTYFDVDITLGSNRLNENVVNEYDGNDRLIRAFTRNYKAFYEYDADGLRTSKTVNGEKTRYIWDDDRIILELSDTGKVQKRYVHGNTGLSGTDLIFADTGEGTKKTYFLYDSHGNVSQLANENGNVTKTYAYDSFGNEIKPKENDDNPFRYCGEYYDKETETVYLRARYYQPQNGRFLTRDTYTGEDDDPVSLHLYAYCGQDPVNAWDPSGNKARGQFKKVYEVDGHKCYSLSHKKDKTKILFEIFAGDMAIDTDGRDKVAKSHNKMRETKFPYFDPYHKKSTSLSVNPDRNGSSKYLSASKIPYVVIQKTHISKAKSGVGSLCIVYDRLTGKSEEAIVGDVQLEEKIGEGSPKLSENLGNNNYYNVATGELSTVGSEYMSNRFLYIVTAKQTKKYRPGNGTYGYRGKQSQLKVEIATGYVNLYNLLKKTGYDFRLLSSLKRWG